MRPVALALCPHSCMWTHTHTHRHTATFHIHFTFLFLCGPRTPTPFYIQETEGLGGWGSSEKRDTRRRRREAPKRTRFNVCVHQPERGRDVRAGERGANLDTASGAAALACYRYPLLLHIIACFSCI